MAKWVKLPSGTFVNTDLIASAAICGGTMTLKRKKPSESILLSMVDTNAMLSWLNANSEIVPPVVTADAPVTVETANDTNAASGQSVRGGDVCMCGHGIGDHVDCGLCGCTGYVSDTEAGK